METEGWERAKGVICPRCGQETLRIIDGLCPRCVQAKEAVETETMEKKATVRYFRRALNHGEVTLGQARDGELRRS